MPTWARSTTTCMPCRRWPTRWSSSPLRRERSGSSARPHLAAVDHQHLAGHAARLLAGEEHRGVGDVGALDLAVERGQRMVVGDHLIGADALLLRRLGDVVGVPDLRALEDVAGGDAIDADAIAAELE